MRRGKYCRNGHEYLMVGFTLDGGYRRCNACYAAKLRRLNARYRRRVLGRDDG